MPDPITALGIAGNIVQFIDFGLKVTSKAREIHRSADGALEENIDLEVVTADLVAVTKKLKTPDGGATGNIGLDDICMRCCGAANDLLSALAGLKLSEQKTRVKSARKALKAIWGKRRVEEMKTRLEGYRDEMRLHILVKLKCAIDVEAIRQSERFDTLDTHAKVILDAISENHESIMEVFQMESAKSDDRHMRTVNTIIAQQEEVHLNVTQTLNETRELVVQAVAAHGGATHNAMSTESSKSDERHRETTDKIVAKQDETHTEVIETLQSLDSSSRAEQEATRRELEQLKQALAQIEQDMKRRDEELKELLKTLSHNHNKRKRKALRERSNAVTAAVYALSTIYETLQKMISGLQSHAKLMLTSANDKIWGTKPESQEVLNILAKRSLWDAIDNKPPNLTSGRNLSRDTLHALQYLQSFSESHYWLHRTWNVDFFGLESIKYETIRQGIAQFAFTRHGSIDEVEATKQLCTLTLFLDMTPSVNLDYDDRDLQMFKSMIILVTFLVEFHDPSTVASLIMDIFGWTAGLTGAEGRGTGRTFPSLQEILVWSTIGQIAGFRKTSRRVLISRLQKWGVTHVKEDNVEVRLIRTRELLNWIAGPPNAKQVFTFNIGGDAYTRAKGNEYHGLGVSSVTQQFEVNRRRAAESYAFVEYLSELGFPFIPSIVVDSNGLRAEIRKKPRDENLPLDPPEYDGLHSLQEGVAIGTQSDTNGDVLLF